MRGWRHVKYMCLYPQHRCKKPGPVEYTLPLWCSDPGSSLNNQINQTMSFGSNKIPCSKIKGERGQRHLTLIYDLYTVLLHKYNTHTHTRKNYYFKLIFHYCTSCLLPFLLEAWAQVFLSWGRYRCGHLLSQIV